MTTAFGPGYQFSKHTLKKTICRRWNLEKLIFFFLKYKGKIELQRGFIFILLLLSCLKFVNVLVTVSCSKSLLVFLYFFGKKSNAKIQFSGYNFLGR